MLTTKQETFVQELVKGKSQREAYRAAYKTERMKETTIDQEACKLLALPKVTERYRALMAEAASKAVATQQDILEELTRLAMPPKDETGERTQETVKEKNTRIRALELLGKYHALFTERVIAEQEKPFEITVSVKKE